VASRSVFRNLALLSGLVSQQQLDEAVASLQGEPSAASPAQLVDLDDSALSARLVELGILTPYQVKELRSGRSKFNLGPYIITDWIGQGGMGHVYKGVHQVMGRETAIKVLPLNRATPDSINNFMREVRTQAQLDHPNLVRAYDAGRDGNVHYLVVEYVPGTDLRRLIRSQGPLTQQQAASVILQAARGLDYAHKRGLIHRDIKPGNILVTSEGIAKVSDLGLAGFVHDAENDPRAGKIVGTADYLSPEQIRTPGDVTHTTDIYSLGCTLYYAVCGKVPFPGGSARDKANRHLNDTPWHPRRFNVDLHEEFVEVLADMMEKNAKTRIQSAAEVVARLEQFADVAAPLATRTSISSPWSAAPLPSGPEEPEAGQDTDGENSVGLSASAEGSASQLSQGTVSASGQDTKTIKPARARPLPIAQAIDLDAEQRSIPAIVALTLVIAIPVSMVAGALIATLALRWLGS
jgi:eukaryotic-like serine/threonine-protein kinase